MAALIPRFHERGFMEEGTTTTPFDMTVLNQMSRYRLAIEADKRLNCNDNDTGAFSAYCQSKLRQHRAYICTNLDDMPEIKKWNRHSKPAAARTSILFPHLS